jgi:hypothetical protein
MRTAFLLRTSQAMNDQDAESHVAGIRTWGNAFLTLPFRY